MNPSLTIEEKQENTDTVLSVLSAVSRCIIGKEKRKLPI
jgi:hypothetical protein